MWMIYKIYLEDMYLSSFVYLVEVGNKLFLRENDLNKKSYQKKNDKFLTQETKNSRMSIPMN